MCYSTASHYTHLVVAYRESVSPTETNKLRDTVQSLRFVVLMYAINFNLSPAGLSMHTFHGNFFVGSTDLLTLPNVNPDHGFCMNISIDENLKEYNNVCFQAALLYTSYRG